MHGGSAAGRRRQHLMDSVELRADDAGQRTVAYFGESYCWLCGADAGGEAGMLRSAADDHRQQRKEGHDPARERERPDSRAL